LPPSQPLTPVATSATDINQRHYWLGPIFRIIWVSIAAGILVSILHHAALFAIHAVQFIILLFFTFAFFEIVLYLSLLGTHTGRLRIAGGLLYYRKFDAKPGFEQPAEPVIPVDLAHLTRAVYRKGRIASRAPVPRVGSLTIYVPASVTITDSKGANAELPMWGWTGQRRLAATLLYCLRQSGAEVDENATSLLQKRARKYNGQLADPSDDESGYFYISDKVNNTPRMSLFKAHVTELIFGLIFAFTLTLILAAVTPGNYKHFNGLLAVAFVLSAAGLSFAIFFMWLSAYMRKVAGRTLPPGNRFVRVFHGGGFLLAMVTTQIGISVYSAANGSLSTDMSLYVTGAIGGFVAVLSLAFILIGHAAVVKVHAYHPKPQN